MILVFCSLVHLSYLFNSAHIHHFPLSLHKETAFQSGLTTYLLILRAENKIMQCQDMYIILSPSHLPYNFLSRPYTTKP